MEFPFWNNGSMACYSPNHPFFQLSNFLNLYWYQSNFGPIPHPQMLFGPFSFPFPFHQHHYHQQQQQPFYQEQQPLQYQHQQQQPQPSQPQPQTPQYKHQQQPQPQLLQYQQHYQQHNFQLNLDCFPQFNPDISFQFSHQEPDWGCSPPDGFPVVPSALDWGKPKREKINSLNVDKNKLLESKEKIAKTTKMEKTKKNKSVIISDVLQVIFPEEHLEFQEKNVNSIEKKQSIPLYLRGTKILQQTNCAGNDLIIDDPEEKKLSLLETWERLLEEKFGSKI